jgi:hypothetical protein
MRPKGARSIFAGGKELKAKKNFFLPKKPFLKKYLQKSLWNAQMA